MPLAIIVDCLPAMAGNPVSLKITYVANRVSPPDGGANGVMLLAFQNNSTRPLTIPGSVVYSGSSQQHRAAPHLKQSRMQHPSPGDFATIRYKWTNKAGEVTLAGTVDFTETLEAIAPQSSKTVLLPVNVPQAAGPYTLTVSFDNERLKPGFMTLGAIPPDYDQFRFVQVQDEVTLAPTTARDPVKQ